MILACCKDYNIVEPIIKGQSPICSLINKPPEEQPEKGFTVIFISHADIKLCENWSILTKMGLFVNLLDLFKRKPQDGKKGKRQ